MRYLMLLGLVLGLGSVRVAKADDATADAVKYCTRIGTADLELRCVSAVRSRVYFERAVLDVCSRATLWTQVIRCFASGAGKTDPVAVNVCFRATTWDTTIECFGAIQDKRYLSDEIRICKNYTAWSGVIKCFRNSGRPVGFDAELIRQEISTAIQQIDDGEPKTARATLQDILSRLP